MSPTTRPEPFNRPKITCGSASTGTRRANRLAPFGNRDFFALPADLFQKAQASCLEFAGSNCLLHDYGQSCHSHIGFYLSFFTGIVNATVFTLPLR